MIDLKQPLTLSSFQRGTKLRGGKTRAGKGKRGPLLIATWDQAYLYTLVVDRRREPMVACDWGTTEIADQQPPLEQLRKWVDEQDHKVEQLLLLMPRAQLDMVPVEVPNAEANELNALVAAEVDGQIGDGEHELVIDYCRLERAISAPPSNGEQSEAVVATAVTAVGFAADAERLRQWQAEAEKHSFQLVGITARQLAPLVTLRQRREVRGRSTVVVCVYSGEVELSCFRGERMVFLRTFRAGVISPGALAEQIQLEIQRSLSTMDFVHDDEPPELLLLDREVPSLSSSNQAAGETNDEDEASFEEDWRELHEALDARLVRLELPLQTGLKVGGRSATSPDPALVGAALEYDTGSLSVDLLNPKRPVEPPNPWKRRGVIAALAVGSLAIVGYLLLSDVATLRETVADQQAELDGAKEVADKLQEKGDETRFVQQWLSDKVDWLSKLQLLSAQFPSGQGANVRRLSAAVNGDVGIFDLSIQVSDPSRVAELENRLRAAGFSVTSEQISEQSGNSEYPWQFEARVAFAIPSLEAREEDMQMREDPSILLAAVGENATGQPAEEGDESQPPSDQASEGNQSPADGNQSAGDGDPSGDEGKPAAEADDVQGEVTT